MQRGLRGGRATYDVLVVGGGVLGAWTAAIAARRGATVALADQFEPAHTRGSSHGDGRIFRLAYHQEHYVDMMLHSLPLWQQLQEFAGEPLMATTGGINIASAREALADLQNLYERRGFAHELMTAAEVNARWPQFALAADLHALYQPDYGVLFASRCVCTACAIGQGFTLTLTLTLSLSLALTLTLTLALTRLRTQLYPNPDPDPDPNPRCVGTAWRYAASLGAELRTGWRAASVEGVEGGAGAGGGALRVTSEGGEAIEAKAVVLAPGAWLTPLAASLFGLAIPTKVTAETVSYFAPTRGGAAAGVDHSHRAMPVFIHDGPNGLGEYGYYGLPMIDVPGMASVGGVN